MVQYGYRFDLMGLIDQDTIKLVDAQGKGRLIHLLWFMEKAGIWIRQFHHIFVQLCKIMHRFHKSAFFNDFFRNTMRGTNENEAKGYISGDNV